MCIYMEKTVTIYHTDCADDLLMRSQKISFRKFSAGLSITALFVVYFHDGSKISEE
jgi:hypothetical protein